MLGIGDIIFAVSATLFPFPTRASGKVLVRGNQAYERSSPILPLPVENSGPCHSLASPPQSVPLANSPRLTLVPVSHDASPQPSERVQKPSVSRHDASDYWDEVEHLREAPTRGFVQWLRQHDVSGHLTQRELLSLYGEFCWYGNFKPLSERRLLNKIKQHGVETFRPSAKVVNGRMTRPTLYKVRMPRRAAA